MSLRSFLLASTAAATLAVPATAVARSPFPTNAEADKLERAFHRLKTHKKDVVNVIRMSRKRRGWARVVYAKPASFSLARAARTTAGNRKAPGVDFDLNGGKATQARSKKNRKGPKEPNAVLKELSDPLFVHLDYKMEGGEEDASYNVPASCDNGDILSGSYHGTFSWTIHARFDLSRPDFTIDDAEKPSESYFAPTSAPTIGSFHSTRHGEDTDPCPNGAGTKRYDGTSDANGIQAAIWSLSAPVLRVPDGLVLLPPFPLNPRSTGNCVGNPICPGNRTFGYPGDLRVILPGVLPSKGPATAAELGSHPFVFPKDNYGKPRGNGHEPTPNPHVLHAAGACEGHAGAKCDDQLDYHGTVTLSVEDGGTK